mmetsp:Transcript_91959/g.162299  ORF Transcript_91959/g.162299 Transcript_91959/m.162299 type:complete len:994 (-) Transcript_91959:90-3071(-)
MKRKADGTAMEANPEQEHKLIVRLLELSQAPASQICLATLGDFLERIIASKGLEDGLQLLAKGWKRSDEGGIVPSTWYGIAPFQESIQTVAVSSFVAASSEEKRRTLLALLSSNVPPRFMNDLLAAGADDPAIPPKILVEIVKPLRGRLINDLQSGHFGRLMRVLRSSKGYIEALVSTCKEELWHPAFEPKFVWRNRKREVVGKQLPGFSLQSTSLLGWVLAPSSLDGALAPPSRKHLTEPGAPEWSDLRRATRSRIDQLQKGTQQKLQTVQKEVSELIDVLVRAGDGPRNAVLSWLGVVLSSAELRGKQGFVAPEGFNFWPQYGQHVIDVMGHNETPPFERSLPNMLLLQALHARIQGFPTSGCALNICAELLRLCKPIKTEQAQSISAFFTLRTDVPELLGSWQKEARFGEKEQIEAATGVAKGDLGYSKPPGDKALFKSQVFWLACKGIGALLLPVAKEAFHTFQGIASVFYEKDPPNAEAGWREFLLGEAALKDPIFLDNLGHFLNLSFRFLQHVASSGKQVLPPCDPGPEWHALPSTILENALDVCDLYRDRQKKSNQIPTGIFAILEPDPILTTLAIVMASDGHVRDPSLRGRAVKLMHRLCFSFHSWQEKLNLSPLRENLIPCLVGVFIGVEKAILSYYDLAYRYKYELRIPVMDLFDLALQNEAHRKVLDSFVKSDGNERFLKLLTQLINDSNSQIDEALKTLKDYRKDKEKQATAAAAAASGSHNEEVLDDDQTAEGEDVYRRSRMNYKEHAKKYFALASKTWKTLWLLCKHCPSAIVEAGPTLEQLLHTSLDAQLHCLVGPEMKNIKATPAEYDELSFDPKELVRQVAEMYLYLARISRAEVARIIAKDERYYSPQTFSKGVVFIRKYRLLMKEDLNEFDGFVKELNENVQGMRSAFEQADIPENYLCEMMADIMSDPVMFPQSKKVVDRSNAVRVIMGQDRDPYANTPLTVSELIPMTDLKQEIHRFAKEKNIALEGGNMFD